MSVPVTGGRTDGMADEGRDGDTRGEGADGGGDGNGLFGEVDGSHGGKEGVELDASSMSVVTSSNGGGVFIQAPTPPPVLSRRRLSNPALPIGHAQPVLARLRLEVAVRLPVRQVIRDGSIPLLAREQL